MAPEHCSANVLGYMNKPQFEVFRAFKKKYEEKNRKYGLKQYLVPYLMSSHPGSTLADAIALAEYLHHENINPEQVQDYYPTPGTISTCMFYTHIDPRTGKEVYVAEKPEEKAMQRALLQWKKPQNEALVRAALIQAGRRDLIGSGPNCLIPERAGEQHPSGTAKGRGKNTAPQTGRQTKAHPAPNCRKTGRR